jgi:hypothetical protein
MRMAWIAMTMMVACGSWAQSPKSSGATERRPPVEINIANQARPEQYPTKDAPLPVTILQSAEEAKRATESERSTREYEKSYLNTQVALTKYACETIFITGIGVLIALGALIFLIRTFRETRRAADAARDQVEVSRDEFVASHRPRLRIRNIAFDWTYAHGTQTSRTYFSVVNVGETAALEIALKVAIVFKFNGRWEDPIERQVTNTPPRPLPEVATGNHQPCYVETVETAQALMHILMNGTLNAGIPIMCIAGSVTYKGRGGAGYSTFFVREFDYVQNTFKPSADPEENYED